MKTQKCIEWTACLLFLILGLLVLLFPVRTGDLFMILAGLFAAASSIPFLIHCFTRKRYLDGVAGLGCLLFALICFLFRSNGARLVCYLLAFYLGVIGGIYVIQAFLSFKASSKDTIGEVFLAVLYVLASAMIAACRTWDVRLVQAVIGFYLLIQAVQILLEMFFWRSPYSARHYTLRNWACLPAFIVGILPSFFIGALADRRLRGKQTHFDQVKNDKPVNFRIWIHSGTYGARLYGHMTFSRNGIMYSYGDYDIGAEKLFHMIGPGIFFTVPEEIYANNCCVVEHSPLFEYGLHLSEKQLAEFDRDMQDVIENTTPWLCPMQQEFSETKKLNFERWKSYYACRLWFRTGCKFRKYHKGEWAWYSLLGNNCSNWAAAKLNLLGLDMPISHGIVSPGEYFEYFETLFQDPDSVVVRKSWHSREVPSTLFEALD